MMKTNEINKYQDIIDSRDVITRVEELESEMDGLEGEELVTWEEENGEELKLLKDLCQQGEDYSEDWQHGATLIRDSYFKDYAQELAEDIGAINKDATWPNTCIDWDQAARELQMDYSSIEFDGITYWIR